MLTWSRFATPFGDGAVVCRKNRLCRVLLPPRTGSKAPARIAKEFPDAAEATGRSRDAARQTARAFEALFNGTPLPANLADTIEWPATTPFRLAVLQACARVPSGSVLSYGELAAEAGYPGRARAAGTVMATNELPLVVPCHRIVRSGGHLGNYGGGTDMKEWLLKAEGALR
ncbi:MAG: methylated-DNA-[protein]-cysteine S-methyltransferase [Candidatus Sumerlaeota bacterium]|nr:methylated-DNA-[protein]-cysteine S-methyltransferase [Candidatus Sumerlaeota bacterium]